MDYEEALMAKAAWYYYFENLTQQQISDQIGVSRLRVVRLLEKARETGMIQFSLRRGSEVRMEAEKRLKDTLSPEDYETFNRILNQINEEVMPTLNDEGDD